MRFAFRPRCCIFATRRQNPNAGKEDNEYNGAEHHATPIARIEGENEESDAGDGSQAKYPGKFRRGGNVVILQGETDFIELLRFFHG